MPEKRFRRTLKRAVDTANMATISYEQLLADRDLYMDIRREAALARKEKRARFVCEQCGHPVYAPREGRTRLPYWAHHKNAPQTCEWWTGDPSTPDQVSARQFKGAQESPLHHRLKYLIAELLRSDPDVQNPVVEQTIIDGLGRRRPDVQATVLGRNVAFEVQLAHTQLPTIVDRESFYGRRGMDLLWLTWAFSAVPRANMPTCFEDIFFSHNKNVLSIDSDTVAASKEAGRFMLRVHWEEGEHWQTKVVGLRDLVWPDTGLPFGVAPPPPWHVQFRAKWNAVTAPDADFWNERKALVAELAQRLNKEQAAGATAEFVAMGSILDFMLSFSEGRPLASGQSNLTELMNSFLNSTARHRYAGLARYIATKSGHEEVLERPSVRAKLRSAEKQKQDGRRSVAGAMAMAVFPEWFDAVRAK